MSIGKYISKYPRIIIDKVSNSANEKLQKKLTVEEYYDLLHHTHDVTGLAYSDGAPSYTELQQTVQELNNIVQQLVSSNSELQEKIKKMQEEIDNMASVGDWDVETEGDQDVNGETIGGFDMTEIE